MFTIIVVLAVIMLYIGLLVKLWVSTARRGGIQQTMSHIGQTLLLVSSGSQADRKS